MALGGQGYLSNCLNQGFTSIPNTLPVNSSQIYLEGNAIQTIEPDAFARYPHVRSLSITESGIEDLQPGAFNHLYELASINLKDNSITILRQHVFQGLKKLQKVVLDGNSLTTIENFALAGIGTEDEGVSLSIKGNADLSEIQEQAFQGANIQEFIIEGSSLASNSLNALPALQKSLKLFFLKDNKIPLLIPPTVFTGFQFMGISLTNNGIENTDFLEHLSTGGLSLTNNPIGPVNFSQYTDLSNIQDIHLGHTNFHTLNPDYFRGLTHLSDLDLSYNGITTVPQTMKSVILRLETLSLEGNPLHCNCDLLWFRTWLTSRGHKVEEAECVTPFKFKPLSHADQSMFTCMPPTMVRIARQLEGGTATLVCRSNGDPPPTLTWTTPTGEHVAAEPGIGTNFTGKTKAQLPLTETDKSGMYSCEARNRKGSSSDSMKVDVYKTIALARSDQQNHSSQLSHWIGLYVLAFCVMSWHFT